MCSLEFWRACKAAINNNDGLYGLVCVLCVLIRQSESIFQIYIFCKHMHFTVPMCNGTFLSFYLAKATPTKHHTSHIILGTIPCLSRVVRMRLSTAATHKTHKHSLSLALSICRNIHVTKEIHKSPDARCLVLFWGCC